jgi:regulatory protein
MAARQQASLRGRALSLLSMREHSRAELARKLAPHAESEEQLAAVLDELVRAGHLSDARFVESLARRRAPRFGRLRIERELAGHCIDEQLQASLLVDLAAGERERARAVWQKRFGRPPQDAADRARQYRFLAQRGFDGETVAWVLRHAGQSEGGDGET